MKVYLRITRKLCPKRLAETRGAVSVPGSNLDN